MAKTLDGIILYQIQPDGCLNGTFSNDHPDVFINKDGKKVGNRFFNEIARKTDENNNDILNNHSALIGNYVSSYIDHGNVIVKCTLEITLGSIRKNKTACEYDFVWKNAKGVVIYQGSGWRIGDQIVVSYRDC